MKLINPSVQLLEQGSGLRGIYKQIELAGRTCYKSEDKITETSAENFVNRMIKSGHGAMLEHGTIYLILQYGKDRNESDRIEKYIKNKYSVCIEDNNGKFYITTNLRVLIENNWIDDLQYICEPTEFHERRYTFRIITSIGITRELIRHRVFSFANESTRYCNYSKSRFDGEVTFIKPYWLGDSDAPETVVLIDSLEKAEIEYHRLVAEGLPAQAAREVLPLATKSEIIMTGFKSDWDRFLDVRLKQSTGPVHPDMLIIAKMINDLLP